MSTVDSSQKVYEGTLVTTSSRLAQSLPLFQSAFKGLAQRRLEHPRAWTVVESENYVHKGVARLDDSIGRQVNLLITLLEGNPGLADELSGGKITNIDLLAKMYEGGQTAVDRLQIVPNLLRDALKLPGIQLPPRSSDNVCATTYSPNDIRTQPLTSEQLDFVKKEGLDGGLNVAPHNIAVALLGMAQPQQPIFYSKTQQPTATRYDMPPGPTRIMNTTHHGVIFTEPSPTVLDLSPVTGRIVRRIGK